MSELRQRLLPIAKPPLALMGALRDFSASVTERVKSLADSREVRRAAALLRIYTENLRRTVEGWRGEASSAASSEPVTGALVKISEGGRALMTLPAKGRELVKLVPEPVQLELRKISTGGAHVCREIFAGILVVGMIAIVGGYGRLAQGPISMPSLVPMIEERHQRRALRPPCEDRRRDPATLSRRSRRAVQAAQHPLDRYQTARSWRRRRSRPSA